MKTCFAEGKLMKQFGTPLSKRTPSFSTNPPISERFLHDPLFVQILKTRNTPVILGGGGGGGNYDVVSLRYKRDYLHARIDIFYIMFYIITMMKKH